ncbi:MAG: class I SAM-dependent methyltransferase, partial [Pseudomonadota bacterium]
MMWQVVFLRNALVALLPFQKRLRSLKRGMFGRTHSIHAGSVYSGGFDHINLLGEAGMDLNGKTVLEIGTGWYPVIPLMLRLAGASHVVLTDEHRLLDSETLAAAVAFLKERREDMATRLEIEVEDVDRVLNIPTGTPLEHKLECLGLSYRVPTNLGGIEQRVDAVISHTVLEHIPPDVLTRIFRQTQGVLKEGGLISHGTDHSDH